MIQLYLISEIELTGYFCICKDFEDFEDSEK